MPAKFHISVSRYTVALNVIIPVMVLSFNSALAQRLDLFTSATGITENGKPVPYRHVAGFYDFISNLQPADTNDGTHNWYYLYFSLPVEVNEIGIRLITPVPVFASPQPGDFVTEAFDSSKQLTTYFNPMLILEQQMTYTRETGVMESTWNMLGKNADSDELISQPNGKSTNSLLRVHDKIYPAGVYRVRFCSELDKDVSASYLVQVGTEPSIKKLKMSRRLSDL